MPTTSLRPGRRLALALVSGAFVVSGAAGVQAQDAGLGGLFQTLFGARPAPASAAPEPAYSPAPGHVAAPPRRHRLREARRPRARYVSLPAADPVEISGKQPVDSKAIAANPTAAILKDETLRPGDIVVMPSGPKVFTGNEARGRTHRMSAFEDVGQSRQIDRKTRQMVMAMMLPVGALPADEARKLLAKTRKAAPPADGNSLSVRVQATNDASEPPRVVSPWRVER